MKYCKFGYQHLYLDHYNGDVYICPWMDPKTTCIGNIIKEDIDKIWKGKNAEFLRKSFKDNSFKHCRMEACPFLQNNDLPEIEDEKKYDELCRTSDRPQYINLAYDFICNQHCQTCRNEIFIPPKNYKESMDKIKERILPYIDTAKQISMSGHGDPFASPYMMDILSNMHPKNKDFKILIETNGVFLDEEHWEKIKHLGKYDIELVVTINSFDKFTYEHISLGGNYDKLMHNLDFIKSLRKDGLIKKYISSLVIQDRNFREIPSFVEKCINQYDVDRIMLKPVYQWGTMDDDVFWYKDVLNPLHPYHKEYLEILQHPALKDPRVYNFGGETEHPCREYPVKSNCICCEVHPMRKTFAHAISAFIPNKIIRKRVRNELMGIK